MQKSLLSLAAVLLLVTLLTPAEANIISGTFSGIVTSSTSGLFPFAVGSPITGDFQYDSDLLVGNFASVFSDPSVKFHVTGFMGWGASSGLGFSVDANGFPVEGGAGWSFDLGIHPGGSLNFNNAFGGNRGGSAQVTYEILGVSDVGSTSTLLGIALAGMALLVGRRK